MTKKNNEGDISVTINFNSQDGEIYDYLVKLPSKTIRNWEVKKIAIAQFIGKAIPVSDPVPKRKSDLDSASGGKFGSKLQEF